jgi:2-polyprenyl-6-hydroxyphenyl methylase / 3-demethylubiquinone-9 3-methyltransferase
MKKTTIDEAEVAKFAQHASEWWNTDGPLKTLHDINPARIQFISNYTSIENCAVLDVGCGGGVLSEGMALKAAAVTGLDVEPDAIAAAKHHAKEARLKINYVCELIEDFESKPFDVITCMEMLEHVSDPQLVIHHCARLLKPGGYLFLSTINRTLHAYASVIIAAEYVLRLLPRQTHEYKKFIKPSELAAMIRKEGLELIGMAGMSYNPLSRTASLQDSMQANYLLACRKL